MIRRNVASQVIYLPALRLTADGTAVTSGASIVVANDGTEAAGTGTLTHYSGGVWKYTPTQGETDAAIVALILTASGADPVVLNLVTTAANTAATAFGANTTAPDNSSIAAIKVVTDRINTGLVADGGVFQFTANMLELSPAAGGLTTEQADTLDSIAVALAGSAPVEPTGTTVFEHLEQIQDSIDTYIASVTAVNGSSGTIVGFPSSLTVGNSYTTDGDNAIHVFIRDENDDPITSVGTHDFTDPDFSCDLIITNSGNAGRVRATVTYVDPGAAESYLKVEIPLSESSRAAAGAATMQCTLKWDGVAKTIATQTVTWVARI